MARDYSGYFMQGLSEGLQSGINMGQQILEIREKRKQKEALKKKEEELFAATVKWNSALTKAYEDNFISDDELSDINVLFLGFSAEFQELHRKTMDDITQGNADAFAKDMQYYDMWLDETEDLSKIGDIPALYEEYTPYFTTEKGRNLIEANVKSKKRRAEGMKPQPEVYATVEELKLKHPDEGYEYSKDAGGYIPTFQKPTTPTTTTIEQKIAGINKLEEVGIITKERADKSRLSIYGGVVPTEAVVTPEGEITAGRKRALDVEKDYRETSKEILYGERDYMGMPISIGIIPMDIQMDVATGEELTNEQKQAILNNYNLRKETFNESVKKYVESILKQLGVDLEPKPKVKEEVKEEVVEKTGIIQSIKDWWKGTPSTPEVPLEEKGALISTMTDQELKDKMREIDPSSEEYKLLEEEAKRRGLLGGDYWTEKYGF